MQLYALPSTILGLAFDIDKTLYDHDEYARHQIDVLIGRLARERGEDPGMTRLAIEQWRSDYAEAHGGVRQSLGNAFAALGVPLATSVLWRKQLIDPGAFLEKDGQLTDALLRLSGQYQLAAVTNNPVAVGRATLEALGVHNHFRIVVGLDTTMLSKPNPAPYARASELLALEPSSMVSVGDRYDIDIAPALMLGMGGILVSGVQDVYTLPERLVRQ